MKRLLNTPYGEKLWRQSLAMVTSMFYLGLALASAGARASDTEVYAGVKTASPDMSPTLMMQLDSGKTVLDAGKFTAFKNAMEAVLKGRKDASGALVVTPIPGNVRLGYSRYQVDGNQGGWVRYPARRLDAFVGLNPKGFVESQPKASADDAEFNVGSVTLTGLHLDTPSDVPAVRFPAVMIPRGATINSAYIEFTPAADGTPDTWLVAVEDADDAAAYKLADSVLSRSYLPEIKVDNPAPWVLDGKYQVGVTSLVQDIANRTGWCGGQAMAFKLDNAASLRSYSWDNDPAKSARLVVDYSLTDPVKQQNTCLDTTFDMPIGLTSGSDDIELVGTSPNASNQALSFPLNQAALRFLPGLAKGATITEATLFLTGKVSGTVSGNKEPSVTGVPSIAVSLFDTATLAPFCIGTTCTFPTDAKVPVGAWAPGTITNKQAINIPMTTAVQALVNRSDWTSGSAIGVHLQPPAGSTNTAAVHSFESVSGYSAQLKVKGTQRFTDISKLRTVRDEIWDELRAMQPSAGATPLADAYQETMRYMMGVNVSGNQSGADARVLTPATQALTSGTDRQFATPITSQNQCAGHFIFLLASGEWTNSNNVNNATQALITPDQPGECSKSYYDADLASDTPNDDELGWSCMFSTAKWGKSETANQRRALVKTNTVLFEKKDAAGNPTGVGPGVTANLQKVATMGGGQGYFASDEASLIAAIKDTVDQLLKEEGTITAPGVAVNQLNRLNNLDQLYYALFKPTDGVNWEGNVKRYRLNLTEYAATPQDDVGIYDLEDKLAVDSRGFFVDEARSWWLPATDIDDDGNEVSRGGVAARLDTPNSRKMFALIGGSTLLISSPTGVLNTTVVDTVQSLNGLATSVEAQNLLDWYRGYEISTTLNATVRQIEGTTTPKERKRLGGVLHSRPILVNYGFTGTAAEALLDPDKQLNTIFFSTLDGTLHAVDAKSGEEEFSLIVEEKLSALLELFKNETRTAPDNLNPEFGMDLTWSVYRKEVAGQLEKVYLYGGMRMGGSSYYALDVTDKSNPKLLFTLKQSDAQYSGMGQTWSQPVVATLRVAGVVKPVLIFGGGYDAAKYEVGGPTYPATGLGNQVYIVDAEDGDLIAKVTDAEMESSIPSQLKTADIDGDGLVDHIYFGDLGGKVFRLDVDNKSATESGLVKRVKLLAELATTSDERRFYEPPTVALFKGTDNKIFAAIGMGSGNRSHPLNKDTNDRFHVLFDRDVTRLDVLTAADSSLQPTIAASELADAGGTVDTSNTKGWYLDMTGPGEKVITSAVFLRNQLVWSSYSPDQTAGSDCAPVIGRSFLYRATIAAGFPSGKIVKTESVFGLGADPQVVILANESDGTKSDIGIVTGTDVELEASGVSAGLQRTRWYEKRKQ